MTRRQLVEACAAAVVDAYDVHEMHDQGMTEGEAFAYTVRIIETEPAALIAWLVDL